MATTTMMTAATTKTMADSTRTPTTVEVRRRTKATRHRITMVAAQGPMARREEDDRLKWEEVVPLHVLRPQMVIAADTRRVAVAVLQVEEVSPWAGAVVPLRMSDRPIQIQLVSCARARSALVC